MNSENKAPNDEGLMLLRRKAIDEVCAAAVKMASSQINGLIVFENNDLLDEYISLEKEQFSALPNARLLVSIFYDKSDMKEGAAVIRSGRIHAAGCTLGLDLTKEAKTDALPEEPEISDISDDPEVSDFLEEPEMAEKKIQKRNEFRELQSIARHITSKTDAVAVLISGTTGYITFFFRNEKKEKLSGDKLKKHLSDTLIIPEEQPEKKGKLSSIFTKPLNSTFIPFLSKPLDKLHDLKIISFFRKAFEKDTNFIVISVILAIFIWGTISISVYPTVEETLYNVPIEISLDGTYAQANQLNITSSSQEAVSVTISGKRSQIGNIKSEDLKAVIDVSTVMMPREYTLGMTIESDKNNEFEVINISPPNVSITFDKIISKEFEVSPYLENVRTAPGYMTGDPIVTPSSVTVTGPQDIINSITKVSAKAVCDKELSSTHEFSTSELVLYNNNAIISTEDKMVSFDKNSFAIQLPVYVRQTLPLEVSIINAPDNFDLEYFRSKLEFSQSELTIAAPNDKIKELTSLNIGTINMREVKIGTKFEFSTSDFLPEGYENLSQVETITVTCPSEGLSTKTIAIMGRNIQFINRPAQFEFTPVASGMTLFLVGDEEQIAELSSADISAQINLINFDMQEGDHKMPVDFIIPYYDKVWLIGEEGVAAPKIYVTAEYIPPEEPEESTEE